MSNLYKLFFFTVTILVGSSCHDCNEHNENTSTYRLELINSWNNLSELLDKPFAMSVHLFNADSPQSTPIHADGGLLESGYEINDLLIVSEIKGDKENSFVRLTDFENTFVTVLPEDYPQTSYIQEPPIIFTESFSDVVFSNPSNRLNCNPISITRILFLDIVPEEDSREVITSCSGELSGMAGTLRLHDRQAIGEGFVIPFETDLLHNNYMKAIYHLGFIEENILTLLLSLNDNTEREVNIDLTDILHSIPTNFLYCKIGIHIDQNEIMTTDISIEPWREGLTENIILK